MSRELPLYHQHVADRNRAAMVSAATALFLERGYDRTSLARVAEDAGVSRATLFKQFPTKASLFEAAVLAMGGSAATALRVPVADDLAAGLRTLGWAYAELLAQPRTADLIRLVITETHRFPDLRDRTFDFGTLPALAALEDFLRAQQAAGRATADAPDLAAPQFLGMIAAATFWPRLVHPTWSIDEDETRRAVEEAVRTTVARYGV